MQKQQEAQAKTPEPLRPRAKIVEIARPQPVPALITDTRPGGIVRGNGEGCSVPFGRGIRNARPIKLEDFNLEIE